MLITVVSNVCVYIIVFLRYFAVLRVINLTEILEITSIFTSEN